MSGSKSDRSMSPAAMTEESRRELIARQHRALYGNDSPAFFSNGSLSDDHSPRPDTQPSGTPTSTSGVRGPSPRNVDPFGALGQAQGQASADATGQASSGAVVGPSPVGPQSRSRSNSTSSPGSGVKPTSYNVFESNHSQQQSHASASTSSPRGGNSESPGARQPVSKPTVVPSIGPIGSRPLQQPTNQATASSLNKNPLPSPLSYGFSPGDVTNTLASGSGVTGNGGPMSATSNPPVSASAAAIPGVGSMDSPNGMGVGWGNKSGVWRSKNSLGVQASVWG